MGLNISTADIKLEYERVPARLEIRTQNARLEYRQKHARVNITTEKPRVLIDQYECFAEEGLKNNYDFTLEASRLGYRQVMDFIAKTARDGRELAAIEKGGNPIAAIAKRDSSPRKEFVLAFIPQSRPKIEVTGGVSIQWERNWEGALTGVEGEYTPGRVDIGFTPARINISVLQYPSVNISYVPEIDVSV